MLEHELGDRYDALIVANIHTCMTPVPRSGEMEMSSPLMFGCATPIAP